MATREWRFLDEVGDGTGNIDFNADVSGGAFILPCIKHPTKDFAVHAVRLSVGDPGAAWTAAKYSASVGNLDRWLGISVQPYVALSIVKSLTAVPTPTNQGGFMADSAYERKFHNFPSGAVLTWSFRVFDKLGGKPGPIVIKAGKTRMGSFINDNFAALSLHRIAALIEWV